jgi:hypothetical protein
MLKDCGMRKLRLKRALFSLLWKCAVLVNPNCGFSIGAAAGGIAISSEIVLLP